MPVFVVSGDGYESGIAMMTMQLLGLHGARSLQGGLPAWTAIPPAP